ncbi:MAG: S-layer homology domain-containing protein [Clostridiales bacterium]|nr:S-layer homology domain-containing protein [Clostridiales bacterium]
MKKIISAIVSAAVALSSLTAFADAVVKINYDFDGSTLGGWGGVANCSKAVYPEGTDNTCVVLPTGSTAQITHTPGVSNAYYGRTLFCGDFYPMEAKLNVNIFLRYFAVDATSGTNTYIGGPSGIAVDGSGVIKVANRAVTLGKCEVGTKYSYIIENDQVNHKFNVYINGIWNGETHPAEGEDSDEFPGYMLAGSYSYPDTWGPVGAWYVYNNTGVIYADNLYMEAPDAVFATSEFTEGSTGITFDCDGYFDTDTIGNIALTRVSADGARELEYGSDYIVEWETVMANFARGAKPTITLAEPVGEGEQIIFDFSAVKDSYGRTLERLNTALPINPDSEAINAVYEDFSANWLNASAVGAVTIDAPASVTPIDGGSTVMLDYSVNSDDISAVELVKTEDEKLIITQPEIDNLDTSPASFNKQVEIVVTMICGSQPIKTVTRKLTIVRRKLLDEANERDDEAVKALSDDIAETVWSPEGGSGELTLSFDEEKAIGGIIAEGEYMDIKYSVSDNGTDFNEITQYPVKAKYFRVNIAGTEEKPAVLSGLEPVTSVYYEDVIARAEDLESLTYTENMTNLTSSQYLTLPKATANGTPISWSSSNRNVIDEYGTVTQTSSRETVILTARAIDSKGKIIEIASVDFTATVAAKTTSASSGGGGGSTGGKKATSPTNVSPIVPKPTEEPYETPEPTAEPEHRKPLFDDMSGVPWAVEAVETLADDGIINGKGNRIFAPNDKITREEFVKLIVTAFDIKGSGSVPEFADVPAAAWYAEYISAAYGAGIISGISDTEFGVGANVTRQDMAVILKRTADYKKLTSEINTDLPELKDIDSTSVYAIDAVKAMLSSGIMNGSGDKLYPANNATRAEAAVMMYRFINNFN